MESRKALAPYFKVWGKEGSLFFTSPIRIIGLWTKLTGYTTKTRKRDRDGIFTCSCFQQREIGLIIRGFEKNRFRLKLQNNSYTEIAQHGKIARTPFW